MACGIGLAMNSAHSLRIRNCAWLACWRIASTAALTAAGPHCRLAGLVVVFVEPVTAAMTRCGEYGLSVNSVLTPISNRLGVNVVEP